jgi:hypothetical protein
MYEVVPWTEGQSPGGRVRTIRRDHQVDGPLSSVAQGHVHSVGAVVEGTDLRAEDVGRAGLHAGVHEQLGQVAPQDIYLADHPFAAEVLDGHFRPSTTPAVHVGDALLLQPHCPRPVQQAHPAQHNASRSPDIHCLPTRPYAVRDLDHRHVHTVPGQQRGDRRTGKAATADEHALEGQVLRRHTRTLKERPVFGNDSPCVCAGDAADRTRMNSPLGAQAGSGT